MLIAEFPKPIAETSPGKPPAMVVTTAGVPELYGMIAPAPAAGRPGRPGAAAGTGPHRWGRRTVAPLGRWTRRAAGASGTRRAVGAGGASRTWGAGWASRAWRAGRTRGPSVTCGADGTGGARLARGAGLAAGTGGARLAPGAGLADWTGRAGGALGPVRARRTRWPPGGENSSRSAFTAIAVSMRVAPNTRRVSRPRACTSASTCSASAPYATHDDDQLRVEGLRGPPQPAPPAPLRDVTSSGARERPRDRARCERVGRVVRACEECQVRGLVALRRRATGREQDEGRREKHHE